MAKYNKMSFELPHFKPSGRFICDESGNLFTISVNPYNGLCLVRLAAHDYSCFAVSDAFAYLRDEGILDDIIYRPDVFDVFHIPEV